MKLNFMIFSFQFFWTASICMASNNDKMKFEYLKPKEDVSNIEVFSLVGADYYPANKKDWDEFHKFNSPLLKSEIPKYVPAKDESSRIAGYKTMKAMDKENADELYVALHAMKNHFNERIPFCGFEPSLGISFLVEGDTFNVLLDLKCGIFRVRRNNVHVGTYNLGADKEVISNLVKGK